MHGMGGHTFAGRPHELRALERWLREMLDPEVHEASAVGETAAAQRRDLQMRAALARTCASPLLDQVRRHSPQLSRLLEQVLSSQDQLVGEAIAALRRQMCVANDVMGSVEGLVSSTNKQIRRNVHKAELMARRARDSREELEKQHVQMRLLEAEHKEVRKTANEYAALVKEIGDRASEALAAQQAQEEASAAEQEQLLRERLDRTVSRVPSRVQGAKAQMGEAISSLELERRRKLTTLHALDSLFDAFQAEHARTMSAENLYARPPAADAQTQGGDIDGDSDEARAARGDLLLQLSLARGKVSRGTDDAEPPAVPVKRWRLGWHLPFALRRQMVNFQPNSRVVPKSMLLRTVFLVYMFRLGGPVDDAQAQHQHAPSASASVSKSGKKSDKAAVASPASPPACGSDRASAAFAATAAERAAAVAASNNALDVPLAETLAKLVSNTYGLQKLSDWHLTEIVNSCKHYKDESARVRVFNHLVGIDSLSIHQRNHKGEKQSPTEFLQQQHLLHEQQLLMLQQQQRTHRRSSAKKASSGGGGGGSSSSSSKRAGGELDGLYCDFSAQASLCSQFVLDFLGRLHVLGGLSVPPVGSEDAAVVYKHFVQQLVPQLLSDWRVLGANEMLAQVSLIKEVSSRAAPGASKSTRNVTSHLSVTEQAHAAERADKEEQLVKVDLDELLLILVEGWERHEAAWRARLRELFLACCGVNRFVLGTVVPCLRIEQASNEDKAKALGWSVHTADPAGATAETAANSAAMDAADEGEPAAPRGLAGGYFAVMNEQQFHRALGMIGVQVSRRQAAIVFGKACAALAERRERRADAVWLEIASARPEDAGRFFYVNQITNERVWDERPWFDTELDQVLSANADFEIDLETFTEQALLYRWDMPETTKAERDDDSVVPGEADCKDKPQSSAPGLELPPVRANGGHPSGGSSSSSSSSSSSPTTRVRRASAVNSASSVVTIPPPRGASTKL